MEQVRSTPRRVRCRDARASRSRGERPTDRGRHGRKTRRTPRRAPQSLPRGERDPRRLRERRARIDHKVRRSLDHSDTLTGDAAQLRVHLAAWLAWASYAASLQGREDSLQPAAHLVDELTPVVESYGLTVVPAIGDPKPRHEEGVEDRARSQMSRTVSSSDGDASPFSRSQSNTGPRRSSGDLPPSLPEFSCQILRNSSHERS